MKDQLIKILKLVVPIGIGLYLTWYFLAGLSEKDIQEIKNSFREANYFWVVLSLLLAFLSHFSRAYRWLFVLEPMGYKPKLINSYHAVMSGYIINYTVPRSGEVARAGLMATYEKIPFEKGFATIVAERVIDLLMFMIVFFISGLLQVNSKEINSITQQDGEPSYTIWYILGGMFILGIIGLIIYFKNQKVKTFVNEKLLGFLEGLKAIWTMKKKWAFIAHTIFIWTCYVGMIWVSAQAFPQTQDMPIGCIFAAFVVGAAAIGATPGGLGLYPLWITGALMAYGIDFKAFGAFMWVTQTGLLVVLGLLSLFLIQRQPKLAQATENE
ncbi:MAG: flippase-like domain-containing protein [Crocinitomicaceae bacterium]|nr:flippase-like domain-containing protein [Flavobacteriales bacterium]NQZ35831.1 flippase-like domain-containing protein [Crocinitomicaceae bacterium]